MIFRSRAIVAGAAVAIACLSGCAMKAPPYSQNIANVSTLKNAGGGPVAVGAFTVKPGIPGANSVSLRGSTMSSSVGSDYAAYLGEALRSELELAGRLDPRSAVEVSGVMTRNDVDGSGISKGTAALEARFVVRRNGEVRFDKVKQSSLEWESSFAGAVAIPKAVQSYTFALQGLLTALVTDPEFQAAIR